LRHTPSYEVFAHVNKLSRPEEPHQLDARAIRLLREVAAEFAFFKSAAEPKTDRGRAASDAITTMLADAVAGPFLAEKQRKCADAFAAHLVWLSEAPLLPGRSYLLQAGAQTIGAMVSELKYRVDVGTPEHLAAKELYRNEIAFVNIATVEPISFDLYEENQVSGGFILIDRHSNSTVAAGVIRFGLRRAANTYFQSFEISKIARARLKGHKSALLWLTGLSGAGKSTIADHLKKNFMRLASTRLCWTATMSVTGSTAILVLPKPTASRIFVGSLRSPSFLLRPV
jgi:hypothetical protein